MTLDHWAYPALTFVAFIAGAIDAISGGGGLLIIPALLFAGMNPLMAIGTNKLQSVFGTAMALRNYWRSGLIDWRASRQTAAVASVGGVIGAIAVQLIGSGPLKIIIPVLLCLSALYVLLSPRITDHDAHHRLTSSQYAPVAGAIGFYDGFFGPGAGSFYTTSLIGLRGNGLTRATALAKLLNLASAFATLLLFALGGHMLWLLGLCMAAGATAGGWVGSHSALRFGARLIRPMLVTISLALTARLIWSYFSA